MTDFPPAATGAFWLLPPVISFVVAALGLWLATHRLRQLPAEAHWTERARLLWPVRVARSTALIWVPIGASLLALWPALGGFVGALFGTVLVFRRLRLPASADISGFRSVAFIIIRLLPLLLPLVLMVRLAGHPLDGTAVSVVAGVLVFNLAWTCGLMRWVCGLLGILRPARERLARLVAAASARLGVPVRRVYELGVPMVNAFAFTATGDMAFTSGALDLLDDEEAGAVIAHELGHLKEPAATKGLRLVMLVPLAVVPLFGPLCQRFGPFAGFGLLFGIMLFLRMMRRFQRKAETDADKVAADDESSAGLYARTLEKLYEANLAPSVIAGVTTHPNLYDRMMDAGVPPAYPRPQAAMKLPGLLCGVVMAGAAVALRIFAERALGWGEY